MQRIKRIVIVSLLLHCLGISVHAQTPTDQKSLRLIHTLQVEALGADLGYPLPVSSMSLHCLR